MSFEPGSYIQERFLLSSLEERTTKQGKRFFSLQLVHGDGTFPGTVWSEAIPNVKVTPNSMVFIEGKVDSYNGKPSITVQSGYTLHDDDPEAFLSEVKSTPTLVFDIETIGVPFESIEVTSQQYLLDREKAKTEEEITAAQSKTGLYPLFGYVGAIGLLDSRKKGVVLLLNEKSVEMDDKRYTCEVFASEKELLVRFWEIVKKYQRFVSYNGAGFDWPFLVFRSGVNRVKVSVSIRQFNKDDNNIDLAAEIPPSRTQYKLSEVTKALGLSNPKEAGVDGGDVTGFFATGRQAEVAQYVARDVSSTLELYELWRTYMSGRVII